MHSANRFNTGLALSGGGSRAAAFHRGTIQGLSEVGLLEELDVISSVSGGSIFAGAWMASKWQNMGIASFLQKIAAELERGFVLRSLNMRAIKLALPSYTRSTLLSETFDSVLFHGMRLADLPEKPSLCINTSVMNTGQVGKFSRGGFSSTGLHAPRTGQQPSNPVIPLPDFPAALAATASAAFPIGLPPVFLVRGKHIPDGWGGPALAAHARFALTDGGVLENLGIQTLLKSRRFAAWNVIISDAGTREGTWRPGGVGSYFRSAIIGAISLPTLERVMVMMNSKENRHMRLSAFGEIERSWLIEIARGRVASRGQHDFLASHSQAPRRRVLFVRLSQTLEEFLNTIPRWRLHELADTAGQSLPEKLPPIRELLSELGVDLLAAIEIHSQFGGDNRIAELNRIGTHFSAMNAGDIHSLAEHARWQAHAAAALYWH
jgi:predicted acylesterase/phospholipase RssA